MPTIQTILPRHLFALINANAQAVIIDVRTPAEFFAVRIDPSRSVPLPRLDPAVLMRGLPSDHPVYVICQTGKHAAKAVEQFDADGFHNAHVVAGGLAAWERAGLPLVRRG